jgi:hypothetical protein
MPASHIAPTGKNQVAVLLIRVRDLHQAVQEAGCNMLHQAMAAGDVLIQIQDQVTGCPWKAWLAANCSVPVRTALLYMRLARHRAEIEAHPDEVSIRSALRLIAKPKPHDTAAGNQESHPDVSSESLPDTSALKSLWTKESEHARTLFCDEVGVSEFRKVWSLDFHRELADRIRVEKFEAQPSVKMTTKFQTALSCLESAEEPSSSEIVRKANITAALNALREIQEIVLAADGKVEVALSLVPAGTLDEIRARLRRRVA